MSHIQFYAIENDAKSIFDWLSQEEEIAFIIPDGNARWRAVNNYIFQGDRVYPLWHVPSGALPLIHADDRSVEDYIADPWKGWKEDAEYEEFSPRFGNAVGIIKLMIRTQSHQNKPKVGLFMPAIGVSSFGWIGNHYSVIGKPAISSTEKFWARLRRWIQKQTVKIPRKGPINGPKPEIWAFPHALAKIDEGYVRNRI